MIFPLIFRERKGEKLLPWTKGKSMLPGDIATVRNPFSVVKNLLKGFSLKATFMGAIFLLTASVGDGINGAILPVLFMQNLQWEPDTYSQVVGGLGTVLEVCGALLGGFLADRMGRRKIITAGWGFCNCSYNIRCFLHSLGKYYLCFSLFSDQSIFQSTGGGGNIFSVHAHFLDQICRNHVYQLHGNL